METSILNGMCRCCALEGTFKDLKCTYHWMGEQEIYGDMLKECFNIDLSNEDGTDSGICEVCITQLRNAVNFKKQVLFTEEQFKKKVQGKFFKANIVKLEVQQDEADSDDNDNNLSTDEAFSNTEFEVPIKMEEPEEPKAKKRAAAKATTSRAKKAKTDAGETSKRIPSGTAKLKLKPHGVSTSTIEAEKICSKDWSVRIKRNNKIETDKVKTTNSVKRNKYIDLTDMVPRNEDIDKLQHNVKMLLMYTNATPIRCYYANFGYACCYCPKRYRKPAALKTHTFEEHDRQAMLKKNPGRPFSVRDFIAKLDITALTCLICCEPIDKLETAIDHIKNEHDKTIYTDIKNQILPFKFEEDRLKCVVCFEFFSTFKALHVHMNMHYNNFQCPKCEFAFVNFKTLRIHYLSHKQGDFACGQCFKIFDTLDKKLRHEKAVHVLGHKMSKCPHCDARFANYHKKIDHMVEVHGAEHMSIKCNACEETFRHQRSLKVHIKKFHLLQRNYKCELCDTTYFSISQLKYHMLKHTGVKNYQCDICSKGYVGKWSLRQHLKKAHSDDKFKCEICDKIFTQKSSWKSHMQTEHDEDV